MMSETTTSVDRAPAAPWDLARLPDGFHDDPYPHYRVLREMAPVARADDGGLLVSRYADAVAIYRDPATFSSDKRVEFGPKFGASPLFMHHTTSLVFNDDPYHGRVRRRLIGALAPRTIARLETSLAQYCEVLTERLAARDQCEAIADYAAQVPLRVIGDMFDIPYGDRAPLRDWSLKILGALEPTLDAQALAEGNRAVREFSAFLDELIARRRRRPGNPADDLLTRLIAEDGAGEKLSGPALVHNAIFLLNAGHETTTNLIGNALYLLAVQHDVRRALRDDPALIASFVQEVLRFESPNQLGNRRAVRTTAIAGLAVAEGTLITLMIGAANRDPAVFAEPERFCAARNPNRHLAFATGGHQCAGLGLARLEGMAAIAAWLRRFPDFALTGQPEWQRRTRFRGLRRLHLAPGV
jgi:cytochrome P450